MTRPFTKTLSLGNILTIQEKQQKMIQLRREAFKSRWFMDANPLWQITVERSNLLQSTCDALTGDVSKADLLAVKLMVIFKEESGIDAGGLTRDWFDSFSKALTEGAEDEKGHSLLTVAPDETLVPRPSPSCSEEENRTRLTKLVAVGRFLGLAILQKQVLPISFNLIFYKALLNLEVSAADVRKWDREFYKQRLVPLMEEGGVEAMNEIYGQPLTFVGAGTAFRAGKEVELKPNGAQIRVTEANKKEYMTLLAKDYLCADAGSEMQALLQGVWDMLPLNFLTELEFTPQAISIMVSGTSDINVEEMRKHTTCDDGGDKEKSQEIEWFWEVLQDMSSEQRCQLLHFATGSSRLPPSGFEGMSPKFTVTLIKGEVGNCPTAHTCGNQLELPAYSSKKELQEKLLLAIRCEGFGFL